MDGSQILFKPDSGWVIVETNGRVLKTAEGEVAAWPKETADMRVTFRNSDSGEGSQRGQAAILKLLADGNSVTDPNSGRNWGLSPNRL